MVTVAVRFDRAVLGEAKSEQLLGGIGLAVAAVLTPEGVAEMKRQIGKHLQRLSRVGKPGTAVKRPAVPKKQVRRARL